MEGLPTDSYGEGSLVPVSACYYGHFSIGVGAWSVEDLVGVAMFCCVEFVGVRVRCQAIMAVWFCHL